MSTKTGTIYVCDQCGNEFLFEPLSMETNLHFCNANCLERYMKLNKDNLTFSAKAK